jgi:hypothetical protein
VGTLVLALHPTHVGSFIANGLIIIIIIIIRNRAKKISLQTLFGRLNKFCIDK